MNLDNMLFAYGKGKGRQVDAKLDLKRSSLTQTMSQAALMNEAEEYGKRMELVETVTKNFGIGRERTRRNTLRARAQYENKLTEQLVVSALFDVFNEALLLDEEFKAKYRGNLYNLTECTFNSMIKEKGLTIKDLKKESSAIMVEIIEICENYAHKAAVEAFPLNEDKKFSKNEKPIEVDLGLDGDFYSEKDFATRNIASLVKEKVVKVIADEKKNAEDQEEFKLDIDDKLDQRTGETDDLLGEDDGETMDDSDLSEGGEDEIEADSTDGAPDPQSEKQMYDDKAGKSMKSESHRFKINSIKRPKKLSENTLFNALTLGIAKKNTMEMKELSENGNIDLDMNLVFAESIAHYTLLETMYTTKLLNINAGEVKSLVTSLVL